MCYYNEYVRWTRGSVGSAACDGEPLVHRAKVAQQDPITITVFELISHYNHYVVITNTLSSLTCHRKFFFFPAKAAM